MHFYPFNIGDYRRRTVYLSPLEHGIYRMLLDTYYLEEKPLNIDLDQLMRTHSIRTEEEKKAIKNVLRDFFKKTKKGFKNKNCDEVIKKYHAKSEKARASAKCRWNANAKRTQSKGNANQEPRTNNHKPIKKTTSKPDRFDEFWNAYDKKVDAKKCRAKFARLNKSEIDKLFSVLTDYVRSKPDRQFRKNPLTWLNGEGWNDEIEFKANSVAATPQPKTAEQIQEEQDKTWKDRGFNSEADMNSFDFEQQMNRYK